MVRRIHDHHGGPDGRVSDCDCPNPLTPEPVLGSEAIWGRPPPTGYRDEHEVYHPGPGSRGYEAHAVCCLTCLLALNNAVVRGEPWALAIRLAPVRLPVAGPGISRKALSVWQPMRLRPQHVGPAAVAVGAVSYAITALLAWWLAAPMLVGLLALLVYAGRHDLFEVDRTPPARLLRR